MSDDTAIAEFSRCIAALRRNATVRSIIKSGEVVLKDLTLDQVAELVKDEAAYYFLLAAAGLNRTSLKREAESAEAQIVEKTLRKAYAIRQHLPHRGDFDNIADRATALRRRDLARKGKGEIEGLFRERLAAEGIPILMSPPVRRVPGLLIGQRKPDGVYPDPEAGARPVVYFEIKNIRRVADDIQKRLYEIAEASLEMKLLYGDLRLEGFGVANPRDVLKRTDELRSRLRSRIAASPPAVVALFLCPRAEAERYRAGAEALVDRIFFQEEIDDCLEFLRQAVIRRKPGRRTRS